MADALSRQFTDEGQMLEWSAPCFSFIEKLRKEYQTLPLFQQLLFDLQQGLTYKYSLSWKNGLLYYNNKLFLVPQSALIPILLKEYHVSPSDGHFGFLKTYKRISSEFFWKGIRKQVEDFVRNCITCQQVKYCTKSPAG